LCTACNTKVKVHEKFQNDRAAARLVASDDSSGGEVMRRRAELRASTTGTAFGGRLEFSVAAPPTMPLQGSKSFDTKVIDYQFLRLRFLLKKVIK